MTKLLQCHLSHFKDQKRVFEPESPAAMFSLRDFFRERNFSLKIRAIRPSTVFETRRRTALCGEGFAWVPDLWSFLKLQEVGFSPYLSFIPILSVLSMFESSEAVRGRLTGPKPLDLWRRPLPGPTRLGGSEPSPGCH